MPVFPGDPAVRLEPALTVARDGAAVAALHLGSHTGTHVDAPRHLLEAATSIDELPVGTFVGEAIVLHVEGLEPRAVIDAHTPGIAERFVGGVGDAVGGARIVLLSTGWDAHWGTDAALAHPSIDPTFAAELVAAGVRVLGVDTLSPDAHGDEGLPVHHAVLDAGGCIIENLTGLTGLPDRVEFIGMPLRIEGGDGSPIRAVARELG